MVRIEIVLFLIFMAVISIRLIYHWITHNRLGFALVYIFFIGVILLLGMLDIREMFTPESMLKLNAAGTLLIVTLWIYVIEAIPISLCGIYSGFTADLSALEDSYDSLPQSDLWDYITELAQRFINVDPLVSLIASLLRQTEDKLKHSIKVGMFSFLAVAVIIDIIEGITFLFKK